MIFVPRLFLVCLLAALAAQISTNPVPANYDEPADGQTDGVYDETAYAEPLNEETDDAPTNDYSDGNEDTLAETTDGATTDAAHEEVTEAPNYDATDGAIDDSINEIPDGEQQLEGRDLFTPSRQFRVSSRSAPQEFTDVDAKPAMDITPILKMSHNAMLQTVRGARSGTNVAYDVMDKTLELLQSLHERKKQLVKDYVKPVASTGISSAIDTVDSGLDTTLSGIKMGVRHGRSLAEGTLTDIEGRLQRGESILPAGVQDGFDRVSKAIGAWVSGNAPPEVDEDSEEDLKELRMKHDEELARQEREAQELRDAEELKYEQALKAAEEMKAAQELKAAQEAREQELRAAQELKAAQEAREQELRAAQELKVAQALKEAREAQAAKAAKEAVVPVPSTARRAGRMLSQSQQGGRGQAGNQSPTARRSFRFPRSFRLT
ncbi:unnamed protein product [Bemisia tabaci]|uniref:Uncharacterized protein n=1 Tax=Bemisia tabaci TaxID=7038 RepID=A0A9P0ABV6_BEMTA|nr:unnamed protein product [Bemisia tabaci]